jgi:hypothetical protein
VLIGKQLMGRLGFIVRLLIMVSVVLSVNIAYAMRPVAIIEQIHTLEIAFPTATNITDKAPIARDQPHYIVKVMILLAMPWNLRV